jgi:hypothetical protein
MKRLALLLLVLVSAGMGITAGGEEDEETVPHDIFGPPPICC